MAEGPCGRAIWPPRPADGRGSESEVNTRLSGVLRHVGRCLPLHLCASFAPALQGSGRSRGEGQAIVRVLAGGNLEAGRERMQRVDSRGCHAPIHSGIGQSGALRAALAQGRPANRPGAAGLFVLGAHGQGVVLDD